MNTVPSNPVFNPRNVKMSHLTDDPALHKNLHAALHFAPNGREMISLFLINKILNRPLPSTAINDIDFYAMDPDQVPLSYCKPKEAYFFAKVVRQRTTQSGHWKASGEEVALMHEDKLVGFERLFIFYSGEKKTNWILHEYRAHPSLIPANAPEIIDSFVVCKIQYQEPDDSTNKLRKYLFLLLLLPG